MLPRPDRHGERASVREDECARRRGATTTPQVTESSAGGEPHQGIHDRMSLNNVSQRNALAVRAIGTNYLNLIPLRSKLYKTLLTLRQRGLELYVITKTHGYKTLLRPLGQRSCDTWTHHGLSFSASYAFAFNHHLRRPSRCRSRAASSGLWRGVHCANREQHHHTRLLQHSTALAMSTDW